MIARSTLWHLRPTLAVLGMVATFAACSSDEQTPLGGNPAAPALTVGIEVSSATAAPGERIAVAAHLAGPSAIEFGALQGTLRFDATRLSYVGQAVEGSKVTMVNAAGAERGQMRLLAYDVAGIGSRSGVLVFEVKGPDYTRALAFDLELAADRKGLLEIRTAAIAPVAEVVDLLLPAEPRPMSRGDWDAALYPGLAAAEAAAGRARLNQPTIANEVYGNANLSAETGYCGPNPGPGGLLSSVSGLDVSYIANLVVGNFDITGSDFPTRDPLIAANVAPAPSATQPLIGLNANGSRTVDGLDVLAVANEVVGNLRPVVCDLVGLPVAPAGSATVTGNITSDTTWTRGTKAVLDGIVRVTNGATLTIQSGAVIEGKQVSTAGTPSALYIERDGRINAIGEPARPIVFTCDAAVKVKGCWGGVVILGNAGINGGQGSAANTAANSPIIAGRAATGGCLSQDYEGSGPNPLTLARFGGCNDADSSGVIKFARFEFGGFQFQANRELNNLTLGGVGSGTVLDFIQVHAGLDDGYEIFGGTSRVRHLLSTGNSDDGFDYSQGWSGNAQFVIVQQDSTDADKGLEIDNAEPPQLLTLTPLTTGAVYNITLIGKINAGGTTGPNAANDVQDGVNLRRGAKTPMFNMVMMGFPSLMDLDDDDTCAGGGPPAWQGVVSANFTTIDNADIETNCPPFAAGVSIEDDYYNATASNTTVAGTGTAILRAPYSLTAPDFRPVNAAAVAGGVVPSGTGIDATATYKGAISPTANVIPWTEPWSRKF